YNLLNAAAGTVIGLAQLPGVVSGALLDALGNVVEAAHRRAPSDRVRDVERRVVDPLGLQRERVALVDGSERVLGAYGSGHDRLDLPEQPLIVRPRQRVALPVDEKGVVHAE